MNERERMREKKKEREKQTSKLSFFLYTKREEKIIFTPSQKTDRFKNGN